ncbi:MAG TPA: hypothetical protein DCX14_05055 [Flavobacteriales bacterium]|nr:hypothetical protein [Flavobacteriales bacterium]
MSSQTFDIPIVILVGGQSKRMGSPKHQLIIDGEPIWERIVKVARMVSDNVFISCRKDQKTEFESPVILDQYEEIGPMGGILSSFEQLQYPSILFLASDNPLVRHETLLELIAANDSSVAATCAKVVGSDYPEPLYSIWNRVAQSLLLQQHLLGKFSLIKTLSKSDIKTINISNLSASNINSPEDFSELTKRLRDQ